MYGAGGTVGATGSGVVARAGGVLAGRAADAAVTRWNECRVQLLTTAGVDVDHLAESSTRVINVITRHVAIRSLMTPFSAVRHSNTLQSNAATFSEKPVQISVSRLLRGFRIKYSVPFCGQEWGLSLNFCLTKNSQKNLFVGKLSLKNAKFDAKTLQVQRWTEWKEGTKKEL